MTIRIQFDDGREVVLTSEQVGTAVLELLAGGLVAEAVRVPARCPRCQWGRIGSNYCSCRLGRDLERIDARGLNPVGGADDE